MQAPGTSTERISLFWSFFNVDLAPRVAASLDVKKIIGRSIPNDTEPFFALEDVGRVEHRNEGGESRKCGRDG